MTKTDETYWSVPRTGNSRRRATKAPRTDRSSIRKALEIINGKDIEESSAFLDSQKTKVTFSGGAVLLLPVADPQIVVPKESLQGVAQAPNTSTSSNDPPSGTSSLALISEPQHFLPIYRSRSNTRSPDTPYNRQASNPQKFTKPDPDVLKQVVEQAKAQVFE